ncbi:MAG TPA: hypothetical protein VNI77_02740 [Nitrososphaera sp.]|nr:hypothetical protein [Nitrososphaera sp.]
MNEGRRNWMTEGQLVKACEAFFKANGYDQIERDKIFDQGDRVFNSLLVGSREDAAGKETIASYFKPRIDRYDIGSFGTLETILYDLLDNYENTHLMLVTDSLSYPPLTKTEELSVALENLMNEGMFVLFMNDRSGYALFDEFKKLTAPIPVPD